MLRIGQRSRRGALADGVLVRAVGSNGAGSTIDFASLHLQVK